MPVSRRCPWRRQVRRSTTSLPQCGPWPRPWTPPAWRRHRERHGSMEWFQAVVLGVLQGLTEFLPISSSAHLRIFPELFGWEDPGASFTAVTQIGTETAVILYFAKDIGRIIAAWFQSLFAGRRRASKGNHAAAPSYDEHAARMGWFVIIGTIPIVIAGLTFQATIRDDFRALWIIGSTLIVFGIILGICDRVGKRERGERDLRFKDAIIIGCAQMLALIQIGRAHV